MVLVNRRRRAARRLSVLAGALILLFASGTAVAAPIAPGQSAPLTSAQSGRCLDVPGNGNGSAAQLWDCTGAANQTWTYTTSRQLVVHGNKCLDAYQQGTGDGTAVIIWDCNGQPNQQWNVNTNGTITGVQSGRCLDVNGAGTANGTRIILWSCHGQSNQQWSAPATPPPTGAGPCDLYASGGTPCVAAHSSTREL